jgi:mono/diheme cytochrome c family protein
VKLPTTLFVGLLAALILGADLPLLPAAQTSGRKNPDFVIASMAGRDLFEFYCSSCHGRDGRGGGHTAPALKVPPPDLTTLSQRNHGTFPAARVEALIKGEERLSTPAHGSSDMPVWGPIFKALDNRDEINAARIENIVRYIESIQAKAKA